MGGLQGERALEERSWGPRKVEILSIFKLLNATHMTDIALGKDMLAQSWNGDVSDWYEVS
jgi:hypothetical protein